SGTARRSGTTITFSINSSANSLTPGSYISNINFNQTTRMATLTVAASTQDTVAVSAAPSAGGTVIGAGTFVAGNSDTVIATPNSGYSFINWTANGSVVSTSPSYTFTV